VSRRPTLPLYVGGFIGPFGGGVLAVLIPQLRDAFDATTAEVVAAIPAYLVPFAVLQLVSGTLGERLGRRRMVRGAYIAYAVFCLAAAVAPGIGVFLVARALQGAANAFTSPLVMAGLADVVPPERLGRSVGTFAAVQTSAVALSPLLGGLLGEIDWRLAFLMPALVAVALAFMPPQDAVRAGAAPSARLRAVLTRRVALLSAIAFAGYASVTGVGFLVAILAEESFGLGSSARGLLLAGFGAVGIVLGRPAGTLVDRFGRVPVIVVGCILSGVAVAAIGQAHSTAALALLWTAAGATSTLIWAGVNTLAIEAVPANRAGATSVVSAFRFAGHAAAPAMWLPLYLASPRTAFLGAGALAAAVAAIAALLPRDRRP
jgi:MFS family permease